MNPQRPRTVERTGRILDVDYVIDDDLTVRIFCVDEDGDPFIAHDTDFEPYFYVIPEADAHDTVAERLDGLELDADGETVRVADVIQEEKTDGREDITAFKVVADVPPDIPKLREHVAGWDMVAETREFDIPFYKRYLVDHDLDPAGWITVTGDETTHQDKPDTLRLDEPPTQTDDGTYTFSTLAFDLEIYDDEIIMCSIYTAEDEVLLVNGVEGIDRDYVAAVDGEAALIERFIAYVNDYDPDIVVGYNTDEFDFDTLRDRADHHNLELTLGRTGERMKFQRRGRFKGANLEGRIHLDLYAFVENVISMGLQSDTLSLDAVAHELLGEKKDDVTWDEMKQYWANEEHLDVFADYALRDAELAYRLSESLVPQITSLSVLTGLPAFDVCRHTYGQLVENFLIRQAHREGRLVPNRPTQEERSQRYREGEYTGGFVYEPERGLHENIALFDFRSLYPTIIVAHNISPDTLDVADCSDPLDVEAGDNTYTFCQDEPGFIPDILEDLVRERYDLKDEMQEVEHGSQAYRDMDNRQQALKILSNAFYGYLGYNGARWYSRPAAEATTALGRQYIHDTIDIAEAMDLEVVYGDTDSVFIKGDDVEAKADAFQERVNDELPAFMELELEGVFVRGLFTYTESGQGAKKKYALLDHDGEVKITGFEMVRRDWSQIAKDTQEQVIRQVLEDEVDAAVDTVQAAIDRLKAKEADLDEVKIYTKMTKNPENYQSKTPHSEAAKRAINRGDDIGAGDIIAYVITDNHGDTISDRAELVEYADSYDPDYYVENQVVPAAIRVLKVLGYTEDQLLGKGKQSGLDRFT